MGMQKIKKINEIMTEQIKHICETREAFDNYYSTKISQGMALGESEIEIIKFISEEFGKNAAICEPGCGMGQIPIALSALGFNNVTGIEVRKDRLDDSEHLKSMVSNKFKNAGKFKLLLDRFPNSNLYDLLITFNFVSTYNNENTDKLLESFKSHGCVIMDISRFGIRRDTEEELHEFLKKINSHGLAFERIFKTIYMVRKVD